MRVQRILLIFLQNKFINKFGLKMSLVFKTKYIHFSLRSVSSILDLYNIILMTIYIKNDITIRNNLRTIRIHKRSEPLIFL